MMQLSAVNIWWFFLSAGSFFAVTHCAVIGDRIYTPCLPHTVACSCSDKASKIVTATVKYCDRNATQCVPCEDFKTLCFRTCREKGKVLAKVRKRRDVCNPDMPSKKGHPKVNITNGLSFTVFVDATVLKLVCEVRSNPAAKISWLFKGKPLLEHNSNGDKYDLDGCNKTLLVNQLEIADAGNYTCTAVNKFGNGSATTLVKVIPKNDGPKVLSFEIENTGYAYVGGSVNLTCLAIATHGFISFERFGHLLQEDGQKYLYIQVPRQNSDHVETTLQIKNISFSDAGNVTCVALDNKFNQVERMIHLPVVPCPEGHYCPLGSNEKYLCPPGTYNDGSTNATYNCTQCPYHAPDNTTKYPSGLTSVTDCPTAEGGTSLPETGPPPNSTLWRYFLIPVGVLLVVVVALVVGWRCLWKKRRSHASWEIDLPRVIDVMDPEGSLIGQEVDVEVKYDAFICYSSKDTKFVQELFEELEKRGFRCCVDVRDFVLGATIVENIADAIYGSRKTLAILSPDFVKSKWCRHEIRQALARIRSHLVVPILFAKCDIPPLLLDRTYLDWQNGRDKEHFWQKLVEALERGKS